MNKNIVVFDLDDTLYKEIDFLISGYHYIAAFLKEKYRLSDVFSLMLKSYFDKQNVFQELNKNFGLDISIREYLEMYRNHFPKIQLDVETKETLSLLNQKKNVIFGLITDGREITQRNKIVALGIDNWIKNENIIISETFGSEKPTLENYLYFQKKYGEADCYYVGDNLNKDFITPNKLNWTTICLLDNGKNVHKQDFKLSKEYLPQFIMSNIKALLKIIY